MSRTYEALKKAERRQARTPGGAVDGPTPPPSGVVWDLADDVKLQYERMQLWVTTRAAQEQPIQTIMVASCERGNGATTTAARLALTMAERATAQVLLVDANLRTPCLDRLFGARGAGGFSDLVTNGNSTNGDYIQPTTRSNVFVLTTGRISPSPLEIFTPMMLSRLVAQLKARYDFVLFDAPPLLEFPDGYALAPHVDAVLLVVEAERTRVDSAQRVMRDLERAGVRPLGVVLNRQRDYMPRLLRRLVGGAH